MCWMGGICTFLKFILVEYCTIKIDIIRYHLWPNSTVLKLFHEKYEYLAVQARVEWK